MKSTFKFKFKFLLLVAVLATALFSVCDAQAYSSVIHYAQNVSGEHITMATMALAVVPLSDYVKQNCSITSDQIKELTLKHGKIKILTVVIEPPTYDNEGKLIDKGEFYSYACKRPDSGTIRMLIDLAENGNNDGYVQAVIKNLIVAGDVETITSDGLVYMGIIQQTRDLIKPYQSFLVNA